MGDPHRRWQALGSVLVYKRVKKVRGREELQMLIISKTFQHRSIYFLSVSDVL